MEEIEKQRQLLLELDEKHNKRRKAILVLIIIAISIMIIVYYWYRFDFSWEYLKNFKKDPSDQRSTILCFSFPIFLVLNLSLIIIALFSRGSLSENNKEFQKYITMVKKYVMTDTFKEFFEDVEVDYGKGLSKETISASGAIEVRSIFESKDYHKGKYKGINFECSDLLIQHREVDNDLDIETDFIGQWYIFDFNKNTKGKLRITKKEKEDYKQPDYIELEDKDFNERFSVYADDKHFAYYVLTPSFIEKIKLLSKEFKAEIYIGIVDNKIHIGVSDLGLYLKDEIMTDYSHKPNIKKIKMELKKEYELIIQIIDILDLDNDLFIKKK